MRLWRKRRSVDDVHFFYIDAINDLNGIRHEMQPKLIVVSVTDVVMSIRRHGDVYGVRRADNSMRAYAKGLAATAREAFKNMGPP